MARQKKPADAVQFTRESAERVARVVRAAELTPAAGSPLTFDKRFPERIPKQVRAATFTGAWPIGSTKVVTFKHEPTATVNAVNLSWPITLGGYVNENCLVGREGTNWWLVAPVLESRDAVFVSVTKSDEYVYKVEVDKDTINYLSDVAITATLNTADCTISVSTAKTVDTKDFVISVAAGKKTAIFIVDSYTSAFLRVRVP
jgi:hypothetical protein